MKKTISSFLEKYQASMEKQENTSVFLDTLNVDQIVYIINSQVDDEDLQFIKKQLNQNRYIGLYTNLKMNHTIKEAFRKIAVLEDDEKSIQDKRFFFGLNKFLWVLLVLATLALIISLALGWGGFPIDQDNDVYRLFIPLVILYGLFVGIDLIRSYLVKNQRINTYLQLNLFKSRKYDIKASWYFIDNERLWLRLDRKYYELEPGWYAVNDPQAIFAFAEIINANTPLPKSIGLNENQVLVWLYEE